MIWHSQRRTRSVCVKADAPFPTPKCNYLAAGSHGSHKSFRQRNIAISKVLTLLTILVATGPLFSARSAVAQTCLFEGTEEVDAQIGIAPLATGDFNGDGRTDWAVATTDMTISIQLSDGQGAFTTVKPVLELDASPADMTAFDFTADGVVDLIVRDGQAVRLYANDGTGLFEFAYQLALPQVRDFEVGYFNEDDFVDIAVITDNSRFLIYLGESEGAFALPAVQTISSINGLTSIACGDFDQDNALDFAVTDTVRDELTLFFGTGDGTFVVGTDDPIFVSPNPRNVLAADLNDDDMLDLVVVSTQFDRVAVYRGVFGGAFNRIQPPIVNLPRDIGGPIAIGDMTGDGHVDVAVTHFSPSRLTILAGDGTTDLAVFAEFATEFSSPWFVAAGDFDGSGVMDLLVNNSGRSSVNVLFAQGGDQDGDEVCAIDDICADGDDRLDRDLDGTPDFCDGCPADSAKNSPGTCGCGISEIDSDADGVLDCNDRCPGGNDTSDRDGDGTADECDGCPDDGNKTLPGLCDCGAADGDGDSDGVPDCDDICAAGDDSVDTDGDGTADACDECPDDPEKAAPGPCGCGVAELDSDEDGVPDCDDRCPGGDDTSDLDDDGVADECDGCPDDPEKISPDLCGCGVGDTDDDADGVPDCDDECPNGDDTSDLDDDGVADECDGCAADPAKAEVGICGCGVPDLDMDEDGVMDCNDRCPGGDDRIDADGDGVPDACDNCPEDSNTDQADEDDNGVGDVCAPSPSMRETLPPTEELDTATQPVPVETASMEEAEESARPTFVGPQLPCGIGSFPASLMVLLSLGLCRLVPMSRRPIVDGDRELDNKW